MHPKTSKGCRLVDTPAAHTQQIGNQGEKGENLFVFTAVSSLMWRASTLDLLSDGLELESLFHYNWR